MSFRPPRPWFLASLAMALAVPSATQAQTNPAKGPTIINPAPTAQDYADLGKLPDWSGVWNPKITDQDQDRKSVV